MAVDIDKLINYNENIYIFSCAAIKRAEYITDLRHWYKNSSLPGENPKVFSIEDKVVSIALEEVLDGAITYHIGE